MGIQSIKSLRMLAIGVIIVNIIGNILYFLEQNGYEFTYLEGINIQIINRMTLFTLLALFLAVAFNKTPKLSEEDSFRVKTKLTPFIFLNIVFIAYILVTVLIFKDKQLITSSLIMEASYICLIIYTKRIYATIFTDHRLKWQMAMAGADEDSLYSSILWRYKIWIYPIEEVPQNRRVFKVYSIIYTAVAIFFAYKFFDSIFVLIFAVIIFKNIFSILEYFFGLYTSLTGVCTGIESFTEKSGRPYYRIYATDFKNKREIVFEMYDTPYFSKNSKIKVVHGVFSKYVVMVNNMQVNYR